MFDAIRRDEANITDVRVEVARVKVDGHDGVAPERRIHVECAVDPALSRIATKLLFVNLAHEKGKNREILNIRYPLSLLVKKNRIFFQRMS